MTPEQQRVRQRQQRAIARRRQAEADEARRAVVAQASDLTAQIDDLREQRGQLLEDASVELRSKEAEVIDLGHIEGTDLQDQQHRSVTDTLRRGFTREAPGPGRILNGLPPYGVARQLTPNTYDPSLEDWTPTLPPVVGFTGRKRSGKNTAAEALTPLGYTQVGFADELKEAALQLDPIIFGKLPPGQPFDDRLSLVVQRVGWEDAKDAYPEVRRILQRLGTDVIRKRDPQFWIRALDDRASCIAGPVVVTDVRFDNEAQWVRDRGGIVIEVVRPDQTDDGDSHASEAGISTTEHPLHIVVNDGTVEQLHARVLDVVRTATSGQAAA